MLPQHADSLSQRKMLVRPACNRRIEGRACYGDRVGGRDNSSDVHCVSVPQLHSECHVRVQVVKVRISKLPQ